MIHAQHVAMFDGNVSDRNVSDRGVSDRDLSASPRRRRAVLTPRGCKRRRTPRPRWQCWMRRGVFGLGALVGLCGLVFALLLAFTPSVSDAEARVQSLDRTAGVRDSGEPIPTAFAGALVATEDSRFYSDNGLDVAGMLRAATTPLHGGQDQGGSTLDQQLAKQLYTNGSSGLSDKIEQVALAVKLDDHYPKQQILEMYASTVYFGHGLYGLKAASCGYFGVHPAQLSEAQASLLAGVLQAPSDYDPLTNLDLARSRQRHVLDRLVATRALTSGQADTVFAAPLGLRTTAPAACR